MTNRPLKICTSSSPESEGGDLLSNILASNAWAAREEEKLIGTDFNPDKWYAFDPQDVNAAYISDNNSITIPQGSSSPHSTMTVLRGGRIWEVLASSSAMKYPMLLTQMAVIPIKTGMSVIGGRKRL